MTNLQPTNGNRGAQPAAETDWLEELRGGSTNVEHLLRMGRSVNVKPETERFERGDGQFVDYRPFVSSITYGVNPGDTITYGDPKSFMVTVERTGGSIDEGWEAIGLVMRVAEDGSTRGGYLVTKPKLDDKGNVVGRYSRVNDIIQTEELTRRSEAGQRQKLAGESAATMAAQTPEANVAKPTSQEQKLLALARLDQAIEHILGQMKFHDKMVDGRRSREWHYLNEELARLRKERQRVQDGD